MKGIWVKLVLASLIALVLGSVALAEGEDEGTAGAAAAGSAGGYSKFDSSDFGFSVSLPDHGSLMTPDSEGWKNDKEVAFEWYGDESDPVTLIQARVDDIGATIDSDTFDIFCKTLLENWTSDTANYAVDTKNSRVPIGANTWNLIEVADSSNKEAKVYYSVFSTYKGSKIYTVSLYYLRPLSEDVQAFGKPVLQSFSAR